MSLENQIRVLTNDKEFLIDKIAAMEKDRDEWRLEWEKLTKKVIQQRMEILKLEQKMLEAASLLQYFTDRVEKGTIKSRTTYGKYKEWLSNNIVSMDSGAPDQTEFKTGHGKSE